MNSEQLGANIFRATQTELKIKRERIIGDTEAGRAHYEIDKKVRKSIKDIGGTMPKEFPTPDKSIKEIKNWIKLPSVK